MVVRGTGSHTHWTAVAAGEWLTELGNRRPGHPTLDAKAGSARPVQSRFANTEEAGPGWDLGLCSSANQVALIAADRFRWGPPLVIRTRARRQLLGGRELAPSLALEPFEAQGAPGES